jgi:hypothetical protein
MRPCAGLLALLLMPAALRAQATADEARLMFTIGIGETTGGGTLWHVGNQPFAVSPGVEDTLSVTRRFRNSLDVVFSGTYFPGEHLGFNVEAQLVGLGTSDSCNLEATLGSARTSGLCSSLNHSTRSATSAAVSAGAVFRMWSDQPVHPYIRANAGFVVSQQSFLKTTGQYTDSLIGTVDVPLYDDGNPANLQPYYSLGGGVVAVIGRGYQLRFEVRDNWVRVPAITGPTVRQGLVPGSSPVGKHLLSFTVGFDVVLERKRGKRY